MHKKLLVFVFIFNFCQAAEQADAKAEAASEVEKKIDKSLAQELNEQEKKELLAARSILFRLKRINADGTKIGPGLPQRLGRSILGFVGEWDELKSMTLPRHGIRCAKILSDDQGILYSHYDSIFTCDGNGEVIQRLNDAGDIFEISPMKDLLATFDGWRTKQMQIWSLENFKKKQTLPIGAGPRPRFMSDASKLVTGTWSDMRIDVWDIKTGSHSATYAEDGMIDALAVSHNGQCIASGSGPRVVHPRTNAHTIKIFDVRSGQIAREMATATNVTNLHFLPGDHELVSSQLNDNGYVYRWDVGTGKKIMAFDHSSVQRLALTKDGTRMVSAGYKGDRPKNYAYLWNVQTGTLLQKFDMEDTSSLEACDISDDGSRVLAAKSNTIKIWNKVDMKKELWQAHAAAVLSKKKSDKADGKTN